ncbi:MULTISPECIES: hypothetical protein [Bacillus cereus group]|uniref:hypothetical protein n=1 Tax=Bacillus cereus group TaxID=86661 RepID=UPI0011A77E15|nr:MULTISPECIES: hypothetical protein [Bacillus cereus group]MDF9638828.1 hypothetical protein [Bacillus cereus]
MEYSVTLHLKSGLEIEYIQKLEIPNVSLDTARSFMQHELCLQDEWMKLDDDASVKRSEVAYFKIKELDEEEEYEGKAITSI